MTHFQARRVKVARSREMAKPGARKTTRALSWAGAALAAATALLWS